MVAKNLPESSALPSPRNKKILVVVILAIFTLWYWFDLNQYVSLEQIKILQQTSGDYITQHLFLAMLIYFLSYIIITGFSLPGAALLTLQIGRAHV